MRITLPDMRLLKWPYARALLFKTFMKMLARQLYLKLTKFTRRSGGTRDLLNKFVKAYDFVRFMVAHNIYTIRRCRECLTRLVAKDVRIVSIYGERDIVEVLYDLTLELPVRIKVIYADSVDQAFRKFKIVPIEESAKGLEKVIVASLVDIDDKAERLRKSGVERERLVLLG
jgi:hypothetical protein